jgi:hypothetical protein
MCNQSKNIAIITSPRSSSNHNGLNCFNEAKASIDDSANNPQSGRMPAACHLQTHNPDPHIQLEGVPGSLIRSSMILFDTVLYHV